MELPLPEVIVAHAPAQLEQIKAQITKGALSILQGEEMQKSISAYLTDTLQKLRPHSIDAIMETLHPESEAKLKKLLSKGLLNVLSRDETSNVINAVLSRQIERVLAAPIGRLSDYISQEKVEKAGANLTETIIAAAREKLPIAIKEFDLGSVVREKINNYPVEKLENLVLSVAKEHLHKIELFGALFGLLIGILQAVQFYFFARH
jgi:uncharacterized membrane protein YheB (UPF0754 family)